MHWPPTSAQGVDQHAGQLQHAEFEDGEQADRAGADDRHVGFDVLGHARPIRRFFVSTSVITPA